MYTEDEFLPVSALSHLVFCERRAALIHIEQVWAENRFTAEGRVQHERVHEPETESRGGIRIVRGLRVHSLQLGLVGMCDVVEFKRLVKQYDKQIESNAVILPGFDGWWQPIPVEHKRGKPKPDQCDEVQLCAQAVCLEEMLHVTIESGAIFYGLPRRRMEVAFDETLRAETRQMATRLHELFQIGKTPTVVYEKKCRNCSLLELCKPKATASPVKSRNYLDNELTELGISSTSEGEKNR